MSEWPNRADLENVIERQKALIEKFRGAAERMRERAADIVVQRFGLSPDTRAQLVAAIRALPLEKTS